MGEGHTGTSFFPLRALLKCLLMTFISNSCQKWVHKRCNGVKESLNKVSHSFVYRCCAAGIVSTGVTNDDKL